MRRQARMEAVSSSATEHIDLEDYVPLVHTLAAIHFGSRREFDDIRAAGLEALCRAARSYRSDRGATFGTYAAHRIRGAMIDYLRQEHGRGGERCVRRREFLSRITSLDALLDDEESTFDIVAPVQRDEIGPAMELVAGLPDRDRFIVVAHELFGMTLEEIAEPLGVTASRVCQLRKAALLQLRTTVDQVDEDERQSAA